MKNFSQIKEEIANVASSGNIMGMGYNKDPLDVAVKPRKKKKKFAGIDVFKITTEEFMKCNHGRKKHERWSRKLDMDRIENQEIREYAHRNPNTPIIIMDEKYGTMSYLIPPPIDEADR